MDDINSIKNSIKNLKPDLENLYGIKKIAIFGSYSKNEQTEDSDIDLVILDIERKNGFLIAKAKSFLSEKLHKEVDLGLYDSLHPFIKKRVDKEMIYV